MLVKDDSVYIKILSSNIYGESIESPEGNGAVIQYVPDAPINLANDPSVTSDTLIKIMWENGLSDGGTPVIDYDVYYDQGAAIANYILLQGGVTQAEFTTTNVLVAGENYSFKVTSRNSVGNSLQSESLTVLAAKEPDAPVSL